MRQLQRTALSQREADWLSAWTQKITTLPPAEQKLRSSECWSDANKNKATNPLRDIEAKLQDMASGYARCMYCEDSQASSIDHFEPRARNPGKTFCWDNYLYACTLCNSNAKRDRFPVDPQTGAPLLIDPTQEDPLDHLVLVPSTGAFEPYWDPETQAESPKGRATIDTFGLSRRAALTIGRRDAWYGLQVLITRYDLCLTRGDAAFAHRVQHIICGHPFSSILVHLLRTAALDPIPQAAHLQPDCQSALDRRPEIFHWLCP